MIFRASVCASFFCCFDINIDLNLKSLAFTASAQLKQLSNAFCCKMLKASQVRQRTITGNANNDIGLRFICLFFPYVRCSSIDKLTNYNVKLCD